MSWLHGQPLKGKPVAILGQGPSLSEDAIDKIVAAGIPVIAIKDSSRYIRDPFLIYACDRKWWIRRWNNPDYAYLKETQAIKVTMNWQKIKDDIPGLKTINYEGIFGLSFKEGYIRHGRNSGYQMVNLAINLGAEPVLLHGFDMQYVEGKSHGVPDHVYVGSQTFKDFVGYFRTMEHDLRVWGGRVINTCMTSALDIFPKVELEQAIKECLDGN